MPEFLPRKVGGRYYAEWWSSGRRHRRALGTGSLEEAKVYLRAFAANYRALTDGTPTTIEQIYDGYRSDREAAGKPAAARIADAWKRLSSHFGGGLMPVSISDGLVSSYTAARRASGASDGTLHVELGYLRAAMRFAHRRRRWIDTEPFIEMPSKPPPRDLFLTKPEARKLIAAAGAHHVRLFIILALSTAGRAGAILGLTWGRIDFERGKIVLADPERAATPKGRATVPMNDMAREALLEAKSGALSEFVIEWGGKPVASVKKAVGRAGERAGVYVSPHVLRHSAAVWMAEAGVPMEEIASYLGHSSVETTRRVYARYSPEYLRKAASALNL